MKRFSLILSFLFGAIGGLGGLDAALVANPDSNTLWMENFDRIELADDGNLGWCNFEPDQMSVEIVDGKARLCETAPGSWGVLQRQVPINPAGYRYLQIRVDQIENIKQYLSLGNANKGGRDMGKTLAGITTVDLTAQPGCDGGGLTLNLVQIGRDGTEPGGWVTVDWIRCVRKPVGGLTFDLIEKGQTNRTAEVGDTIQLRYFAGEPIPGKSVVARFYTTNHMLPYSFDGSEAVLLKDDGTDGDETAGDQVYSKAFVIGPDALSLTALEPAPGGALLVSAAMGSEQTYAYSSCLFDIRTARKLDFSDDYGVTPLTVQNRMRWMREIKGENLALGKPVRYSLESDYHLTKAGDTDLTDLTDGKLSGRADDKIWFDAAAVGWYFSKPTLGLNILIDLGSVQPIEKLVARFLGGAEQGGLFFPAEFAVVASEDGKTFHQVSSLIKLMPAERNRAGEPGNYYLPENGTAYTYPFVFPLKIRARYIGLAVKGAKDAVFCDEIAVIKGNFREGAKESLTARPVVPFVTEGLVFGPAKPLLAISTNIVTPNFFRLLDCRPLADRAKPATCVIELPAAVKVLPGIASTNVAT